MKSVALKPTSHRLTVQLSNFRRYWEILYVLTESNLKVRYRGSVLGVYWSLINPMVMTVLYTLVFGAAFASYYNNSILNYVLAAFTGLVVINFFSSSTSQALTSVVANGPLLNKISLPTSVFPVSAICANIFQLTVGALPLLALTTIITSKSIINVFALVFPITALALTSAGFGLLVSSLYIFFRDLPYFYELVVFVFWIASPVFYPAEIVSEKIRPLLNLNPLSSLIECLRDISLSGNLPDLKLMIYALLKSVMIAVVGWLFFRQNRDQFMDLL